jgi:predicted nucleic acid-binding protein
VAFVLDASLALGWSFSDEPTPEGALSFDSLGREQAVVPAVWPYEVANALAIAERRGRITRNDATQLASVFVSYAVEVDALSPSHAFTTVLDIARDYSLSSYDAAYLELAIRRALPLATLDEALRAAAADAGVSALGSQ